ncbi:MAG TPA: GtrA family protein [Candidatus Paceibacterota bacterium]|nr:GtrA family protein [Candidatus Paceibacterota bacterium]
MSRLLTPAARRFLRYAAVGVTTLAFDLVLLAFVIEVGGVPYYTAVPVCFAIAVSINYLVSRKHVFRGTARNFHTGYLYFLLAAAGGATLTTSGVALLIEGFGMHYLPARLGVAGVVGICNYLLNLHFNFRVVGLHYSAPETVYNSGKN